MKKYIFPLFAAIFFLLTLSSCKQENKEGIKSEKEGMEYYWKGDYQKAFPLLQKSADSGNAESTYYLGEMYRLGNGVEKDNESAFKYYLKSAEEEKKEAFYSVGQAYYFGKGVERNYQKAFKWFIKSSEKINWANPSKNDKLIMSILGDMYALGQGTLQDFSEAAKWYQKAAELGNGRAQGMLAFFYYSGQGVFLNKQKARYWAEKAASQGDMMGEFALGMLYQYRDNPDMKQAIEWYEKSAEKNNEVAQYQLGVIYEKGSGIEQDLAKAHHYYQLAAQSGKAPMIKALSDFEIRHNLNKKD